ncbi:MAG: hypothetical protein CMP23_06395 [Rickettsiales bacterium]|nr:hypothetical protein [Rickettsiales bacterium]
MCACERPVPEPPIERISCDQDINGIPWGADQPPESDSDVTAELSELDLSQLPDPIDISQMVEIDRGLISYALEIAPTELGPLLSHEQALMAGVLGEVVLASIARSDNPDWLDLDFFRRGLQHYYTCSKGFPTTLAGFESELLAFSGRQGTVVDSVAKCTERRLIAAPESGIYVSQTLFEGVVEETEIVLTDWRNDGQLDFVVYDAEGRLTDRSLFPSLGGTPAVMGAPYSCMSCHFNVTDEVWSYDLRFPDSGICKD